MPVAPRLPKVEVIRRLIAEKGLTILTLAKMSGLGESTISSLKDDKSVTMDTIDRLAEALGVSADLISTVNVPSRKAPSQDVHQDVLVVSDQRKAETAAIERLQGHGCKAATLVDFTPHVNRGFLEDLLALGAEQIKLVFGSVAEAIRLESQRQAHLLSNFLSSDLGVDFATSISKGEARLAQAGRNKATEFPDVPQAGGDGDAGFAHTTPGDRDVTMMIIHQNLPTSFRGFRVDDEVVCLGWSVWFPTFNDCKNQDDTTDRIIGDYKRSGIADAKGLWDRLTLNGSQMPHILAFKPKREVEGSAYSILSSIFDKYVHAVSHYWDLHYDREAQIPRPVHPDLVVTPVPDPKRTEARIDPRCSYYWPGSVINHAGREEELPGEAGRPREAPDRE